MNPVNTFKSLSINKKNIIITFSFLIIATIATAVLVVITENTNNASTMYFLAVLCISRLTHGYSCGVIASILGLIGINYYFTYPYFTLNFSQFGYPITFAGMLITSLLTSTMTVRIKEAARLSTLREQRTGELYEINKTLLVTRGRESIMIITTEYLSKLLNLPVIFYSKSPKITKDNNEKSLKSQDPNSKSESISPDEDPSMIYSNYGSKDIFFKDSELSAASYSFEMKLPTGRGTKNFPFCQGLYLPVMAQDNILGIIGIMNYSKATLDNSTLELIDMIITQVAMALERQRLSDEQRQILVETEKEKMRSNLLRSVSHDLRTPLTGIVGSSSALLDNKAYIDEETNDKLIRGIYDDANWLIRLVENLLSVTRINESTATLAKSPEAVEEIVAEAVGRIKKRFPNRQLKIKVPEEFIMVPMDAILNEQVLINLLENALKYAGNEVIVELTVSIKDNNVLFEVKDNGLGIPKDLLPNIFKSYQIRKGKSSDSSRGIGIGLSI